MTRSDADKSKIKQKIHHIKLRDTESACGINFLVFGTTMSLKEEDVTCSVCNEILKNRKR